MNTKTFIFIIYLTLGLLVINVKADTSPLGFDGGITFITQTSDQKQFTAGNEASADLFIHYQQPKWQLNLHIEGNITPENDSITAKLSDANADAFTATDQYDHGRIQLSELNIDYLMQGVIEKISFGLLNIPAFYDTNAVLNNENEQFISAQFLNNPTIDFPDYTLGITTSLNIGWQPQLKTQFGIFSGAGIADNAGRNYQEVIEMNPDKKGLFVIAETELFHTSSHNTSIGAWVHTGPHTSINDASKANLYNYGIYLTKSMHKGKNTLAFRAGISNPEVNTLNKFVSIGLAHRYSSNWTTAIAGSLQPSNNAKVHLESYAKYQFNQVNLSITPSVQYFYNEVIAQSVTLANLRLTYLF